MRLLLQRLCLIAAAGVVLWAVPATAISGLTLKAGPTRLEFYPENESVQTVSAWVSGGFQGQVVFQLVDAVVNPNGGFLDVPYGSTANSLQGFALLEDSVFQYEPADQEQFFEATLSIDARGLDRPRYGSIIVTLQPDESSQEGFSVQSTAAVAVQVLAAPSAETLRSFAETTPHLSLSSVSVAAIKPWTLVDRVFPDVPGLINHGPVTVTIEGKNTGTTILDRRVTYEFYRVSPLSLFSSPSGSPIYRAENSPHFVLAGQSYEDHMSSLIAVKDGPTVDALPLVGFVKIRVSTDGSIAGLEAPSATRTVTRLVFPWKESLFAFLVWLCQREWRHRKGRRVNSGETPPRPTIRARFRERLRRSGAPRHL